MHEGMQILISRMESHPDEFIDGKWDMFFQDYRMDCFSVEDIEAFNNAKVKMVEYRRERQRRYYTEAVVGMIMGIEENNDNKRSDARQTIRVAMTGGSNIFGGVGLAGTNATGQYSIAPQGTVNTLQGVR